MKKYNIESVKRLVNKYAEVREQNGETNNTLNIVAKEFNKLVENKEISLNDKEIVNELLLYDKVTYIDWKERDERVKQFKELLHMIEKLETSDKSIILKIIAISFVKKDVKDIAKKIIEQS